MEKQLMTDEEVTNLRDLNKNVYDTLVSLGDIEAAINRLAIQKKTMLFDHETARTYLQEKQKELVDVYGEKKVNLETGELT